MVLLIHRVAGPGRLKLPPRARLATVNTAFLLVTNYHVQELQQAHLVYRLCLQENFFSIIISLFTHIVKHLVNVYVAPQLPCSLQQLSSSRPQTIIPSSPFLSLSSLPLDTPCPVCLMSQLSAVPILGA